MDALQLLEEVGRVDGVDPGVLDRTADALRQATDAEARNRAVDVHAGSPSAPSTPFVVSDARAARWTGRGRLGADAVGDGHSRAR